MAGHGEGLGPANPQAPPEFRTASGLSGVRRYGPADPPEGLPRRAGRIPFTRGLHADGYRGRLWTMRQYGGYATPAESNRRYRYLLEQGQTGLSVAFDLPTQLGYDADHPLAEGEVGRVGVSIGAWRTSPSSSARSPSIGSAPQ